MNTPLTFTIPMPDDMHLHVRDGAIMQAVIGDTARQCARAIIMPNLVPPVTDTAMAVAYHDRIKQAAGEDFTPLMTLYLTDNTPPPEIVAAKESGVVHGVKLYPAGATTNSDAGVTALEKVTGVLEAMQKQEMPLLIHGEVTDPEIDIFDREARFIEEKLLWIRERFPDLRIVFEHITTREAVEYVLESPSHVVATITAHHLHYSRNDLLAGGIKPHYYCLPILKRDHHRTALVQAATGGTHKFFAGTDSAPHIQSRKESDCGCAGCYTAPVTVALYAEIFDEVLGLERQEAQARFQGFMSEYGAAFYRLPVNETRLRLVQEPVEVPSVLDTPEGPVIPLRAGETVGWRVEKI